MIVKSPPVIVVSAPIETALVKTDVPFTVRPPDKVVSPVTPSVLPTVVAPETARVSESVVAPETARVPDRVEFPNVVKSL